jgi:protease IV
VQAARKRPGVREAVERGPYGAVEAKERDLIDEVGYESEAREDAKRRAAAGQTSVSFGPESRSGGGGGIAEIIRILTGADDAAGGKPRVAVVPAEGGIALESGGVLFDEGGISERALSKTLRRLGKEEAVTRPSEIWRRAAATTWLAPRTALSQSAPASWARLAWWAGR